MIHSSPMDLIVPYTFLLFTIPLILHLTIYILLPAEALKKDELEMLRMIDNIFNDTVNGNVKREFKIQMKASIIQIHQEPMELQLFNHVTLDLSMISTLFAQIAAWFIILLQFELDSVKTRV